MTDKTVAVLGGGIIGVCTALEAQRAGFQVTLIDRIEPGRETSFGNAGVLSESSILVLNSPRLLKSLPRLLLNKGADFRYSPRFVMKNLRWFLSFLRHCNDRHMRHAAAALRALQCLSLDRHKALIAEAGVTDLLRHQGWMKVFRSTASFAAFKNDLKILKEMGVAYTVYDKDQIRQIEPGLSSIYEKAVLFDDTCSISNPAKLTDAYVDLFEAAGGHVLRGEVACLNAGGLDSDGGWEVGLKSGQTITASQIVLAAGVWSVDLAAQIGYQIPLLPERGYHRHLSPAKNTPPLNRAIHDVDGGYAIAPMQTGVRITTGVEMNAINAPPNYQQLDLAIDDARHHQGFGAAVDAEPWLGRRPTCPDSLPMIGKAPRHEGLYFNFGHQHVGLSMATGSGQIIAALLQGKPPPIDIATFQPSRFSL